MTRVYAIHTGSYSDQGWGPVFSTAEKALAYKKKYGDDAEVEVHVLDDENDTGPVYQRWRFVFDKDGNVLHVEKWGKEPYEAALHKPEVWKPYRGGGGWGIPKDYPGAVLVVDNIRAPDKAHAIKIAADARFKYLATKT